MTPLHQRCYHFLREVTQSRLLHTGGLALLAEACQPTYVDNMSHNNSPVQIYIPRRPLRGIKGVTFSVTFPPFRNLILYQRVGGDDLLSRRFITGSGPDQQN